MMGFSDLSPEARRYSERIRREREMKEREEQKRKIIKVLRTVKSKPGIFKTPDDFERNYEDLYNRIADKIMEELGL